MSASWARRSLARALCCVLVTLPLLGCAVVEQPPTEVSAGVGLPPAAAVGAPEVLDVRIEVRTDVGPDAAPDPVRLGADVSVVVIGDPTGPADEVRVDEFDVSAVMPAGGRGVLRFRADRAGFFPIEAVGAGTVLAVLEVIDPGA